MRFVLQGNSKTDTRGRRMRSDGGNVPRKKARKGKFKGLVDVSDTVMVTV